MSTLDFFYFLKTPGATQFQFVTKETFYAAARRVGDTRSQIFGFIGDDEEGNEWRGKVDYKAGKES